MTRAASAITIVSGEIEKLEDAWHSLIAAADGLCIGCGPKNRHHARCEPSLCSVCTSREANKIGRIPETYQDLRNAGLVPEVLREGFRTLTPPQPPYTHAHPSVPRLQQLWRLYQVPQQCHSGGWDECGEVRL